jgi:GTP-binding protein EngB required for normal cell division
VATLNAHQGRRVSSTLAYVATLLREVERLARIREGPFERERQDLSDVEADLVLSFVETARQRMLGALDLLQLARPSASLSVRWSIVTAMRFMDTALSELTTATLSGYGTIDQESAAQVMAVAGALRDLVARGIDLLQPREGEQLRERLADLDGPLGEILRGAEALSTAHGLVEVRPLIAAAYERARASTIDVGVFGRVSSGKSSLVNALVGVPLLPVGATPVTAVPLRVSHGAAEIRVRYRDGREEVVAPERLPEFATESGNRDNERGVLSILIHTPHLPDGLALLDTPGVGSLSQSGPSQAFAWLPRCDLGLVLVAAGTPVGRDELALVSGLTRAGIAVQVLLSKSDLLAPAELEHAVAYVGEEIGRTTDTSAVVVRPVSVEASRRELLERWRDDALLPLVDARQQIAGEALGRRVRALLASLNVAMGGRSSIAGSAIDVQRIRQESRQEIEALVDELYDAPAAALERAAEDVARAWTNGRDARAAARHALLDEPVRALARARSAADRVLGDEQGTGGDRGARIPPLFDPPLLDSLPVPSRPGVMDRMLGASAARSHLSAVTKPLSDAYSTYTNRLRAWAMERLEDNVERHSASRAGDTGPMHDALQPLAALIDRVFPQ